MRSLVTDEINLTTVASVYQKIKEDKNTELSKKLLDIFIKQDRQEFIICFSGQFSAGKSSMINYLLENEILPQSPIPTSANVVKISSGKTYAKVYFKEQKPLEYVEDINLDELQSYCKDGDAIHRIEVKTPTTIIPENVFLLDTPGIDSSNDADRVMTESSLHTVDVLFYVMDYNHVQSEDNLYFLKQVQESNKDFFIIINQIDKHRNNEIDFSQYQKEVEDTFTNWGLYPTSIFYTTLLKDNHPHNQLTELKKTLQSLISRKRDFINKTVYHSTEHLIGQHVELLRENMNQTKNQLTAQLKLLDSELSLEMSYEQALEKLEQTYTFVEKNKKKFQSLVANTLKNAYLMPAELRDKANQFLHSHQPGFKLGLFSTKKKIAMEKENRLKTFYQPFIENVQAAIDWKLREKWTAFMKDLEISDSAIINKIQSFTVSYDSKRLTDLIKPGANVTGGYLLVYAEDLSNDIKRMYKQEAMLVWNEIEKKLHEKVKEKQANLQSIIKNYENKYKIKNQINEMDNFLTIKRQELNNLLQNRASSSSLLLEMKQVVKDYNENEHKNKPVQKTDISSLQRNITAVETIESEDTGQDNLDLTSEEVRDKLTKTASLIKGVNGFEILFNDLIQRKNRITNKKYTVALFGAFSAGKSSFANALIGSELLPVSPNPTTAAINKICPPTREYQHGTIRVKWKDEARLLADINNVIMNTTFTEVEEFINWYHTNEANFRLDDNHKSFLHAIVEGYSFGKDQLGKEETITLTQFPEYVATETLACYIDWIELYYQCPITEQGITIVDTPGADSVNARHTDVTFNYIKQSDAILFVTYYNHAFSKADREFLYQLGRVKDSFSMDKMFFIVNAADLAKDKKELELVTNYVQERLIQHGIMKPSIFPVSSHMAIENKSNSGMEAFMHVFNDFITKELMDILLKSATHDMKRVKQQVDSYLDFAMKSIEEKTELLTNYKRQQNSVIEYINNLQIEPYVNEIKEKTNKQVYYVEERVTIQFNERFKEFFNPSMIKHNGTEGKEEVNYSLDLLINEIGFQLEQELRAVCIRLEAFLNKKMKELHLSILNYSNASIPEVSLDAWEEQIYQAPNLANPWKEMDYSKFKKALALFKNKKTFFEKNEKNEMRDSIFTILKPDIHSYLNQNKEIIMTHYVSQWSDVTNETKEKINTSIINYFNGLTSALEDSDEWSKLKEIKFELTSV